MFLLELYAQERNLSQLIASNSRISRGLARLLVGALLVPGLLAGCSPEYNWREVRPAEQRYQVMFPGKPSMATREINLDGEQRKMHLAATQAGGHLFSVGTVQLPNDTAAAQQRALAAMRAQMVKNLSATEKIAKPLQVPVRDLQGAVRGQAAGLQIDANVANAKPGQANQMYAGFVARAGLAYQFLVVGNNPDLEQVQTFLESFRLLE